MITGDVMEVSLLQARYRKLRFVMIDSLPVPSRNQYSNDPHFNFRSIKQVSPLDTPNANSFICTYFPAYWLDNQHIMLVLIAWFMFPSNNNTPQSSNI